MQAASYLRFSLRELLLLVVVFAIGSVALKYANQTWETAISAVALLAFMVAMIIALIDRGPRQAFAIGFTACLFLYAALITSRAVGVSPAPNGVIFNPEMDPYEGSLPTTKILLPLFQKISSVSYVDNSTGKVLPDYDPTAASSQRPFGGLTAGIVEFPMRAHFMAVAHYLWSLLLGFVGGHFARIVYVRRITENATD